MKTRTKGGQVGSGGDNGRGVKAVSGGGSEGDGGDDVEWEALKAVGVDEALRAVGAVGRRGQILLQDLLSRTKAGQVGIMAEE